MLDHLFQLGETCVSASWDVSQLGETYVSPFSAWWDMCLTFFNSWLKHCPLAAGGVIYWKWTYAVIYVCITLDLGGIFSFCFQICIQQMFTEWPLLFINILFKWIRDHRCEIVAMIKKIPKMSSKCSVLSRFSKGQVPSEKGTFSAVNGPSKGHN